MAPCVTLQRVSHGAFADAEASGQRGNCVPTRSIQSAHLGDRLGSQFGPAISLALGLAVPQSRLASVKDVLLASDVLEVFNTVIEFVAVLVVYFAAQTRRAKRQRRRSKEGKANKVVYFSTLGRAAFSKVENVVTAVVDLQFTNALFLFSPGRVNAVQGSHSTFA